MVSFSASWTCSPLYSPCVLGARRTPPLGLHPQVRREAYPRLSRPGDEPQRLAPDRRRSGARRMETTPASPRHVPKDCPMIISQHERLPLMATFQTPMSLPM